MGHINMNVEVRDYVGVNIDVDDVLNLIEDKDILSYVFDQIDEDLIIEKLDKHQRQKLFDIKSGSNYLHEFLVDEYRRGPYSDINFDKLFDDMSIERYVNDE